MLALAGPEDTIWVHDYQLLLPELLRSLQPVEVARQPAYAMPTRALVVFLVNFTSG